MVHHHMGHVVVWVIHLYYTKNAKCREALAFHRKSGQKYDKWVWKNSPNPKIYLFHSITLYIIKAGIKKYIVRKSGNKGTMKCKFYDILQFITSVFYSLAWKKVVLSNNVTVHHISPVITNIRGILFIIYLIFNWYKMASKLIHTAG